MAGLFLMMLVRMSSVVLSHEQVELLVRTRDLLEELIETLSVMGDREMVEAVRRGEEDLKAGRRRGYREFIGELRKSGEI